MSGFEGGTRQNAYLPALRARGIKSFSFSVNAFSAAAPTTEHEAIYAFLNHRARLSAARTRDRPLGIGRRRIGERLAIAEAVVGGKRIAAVARDLGVSRSWASREAHRPGTMAMIHALRLPEGQQVKALVFAFSAQLAARERRGFEALLGRVQK